MAKQEKTEKEIFCCDGGDGCANMQMPGPVIFWGDSLPRKCILKNTTKSLRAEKGTSINTLGTLGGKSKSQQSRKCMTTTNTTNV